MADYVFRVSLFRVEARRGGIHLPELGLWLDPHKPQTGPEIAIVSHAHSDHIAAHREVILTAPTAALMQARVRGKRIEHLLEFGKPAVFTHGELPFEVTLLPAGHIIGSAMALVEAGGESLLYTGDFKLHRGLSAEPCEPRHADVLIMETTFGQPEYRFPPAREVLDGVIRFCRDALANNETPVLLGYSLGKSQELLCGLADAGLPIVLHEQVFKIAQIYEHCGQAFPPYERLRDANARGKVLIAPPNLARSAALNGLGRVRVAVATGWAIDPGCRFRYCVDAAFPLSDHADFPDLLDMVERVQPKTIYTVHGYATEFAETLRERGWDARALGRQEQLSLKIALGS